MSQEELAQLRKEKEEFEAKLRALEEREKKLEAEEQARKEAKEREELLKKPVKILVSERKGGNLVLLSDYRPDIVELIQAVPGRIFRGYEHQREGKLGRNLIPISRWEGLREKLEVLPFVTVEWQSGVKEELEWYLTAPPWLVDLHDNQRHLLVKRGPQEPDRFILNGIPGSEWSYDGEGGYWKIPVVEGWRVFKALADIDGVVYTEAAKTLIFQQVESREKINLIAVKEDSQAFADLLDREFEIRGETKTFNDHMRRFQRVGVEFGVETGGRFILADDTGLGKTWISTAISEVLRKQRGKENHTTLAVVPAGNLPNWRREIRNLTGEEAYVCKTSKPDEVDAHKVIVERPKFMLISYGTLGRGRTLIKWTADEEWRDMTKEEKKNYPKEKLHMIPYVKTLYPWVELFLSVDPPDVVLLDEAHKIKNPDANRTKAALRLKEAPSVIPMTASPVLSRMKELWPLLHIVNPDLFKSQNQFEVNYTLGGEAVRNANQLHEMIRPFFLRRRKNEVQKDLPDINRIQLFHELSDDGKERYKEVKQGLYRVIDLYDPLKKGPQATSIVHILSELTRLAQVCSADKAKEFTPALATQLIDEHDEDDDAKVLIFTRFKPVAYAIAQRLGGEAICTVSPTPDGEFKSMNPQQRDALFESARGNPQVKFIITTADPTTGLEGCNLEFCKWVIFNDLYWTPKAHDQCEGRSHGRLRDPSPADSFYVVADTPIERAWLEMLDRKLAIVDEGIEKIEDERKVMTSVANELIQKMKDELWMREE